MIQRVSVILLGLALAHSGGAHHSTANFDRSVSVTVTGNVTKFQFANPHSLIVMDGVNEESGENFSYNVFATSKVVLLRYGWRPDSVNVGDKISITGHPDRYDGSFVYLTGIEFANGTEWYRSEILE